jgi:YD repeat-containing protein
MVPPRTSYKIAVAILLFSLPYSAAAGEFAPLAPLTMEGKYSVAWNGVPIGRIRLTAREDASHYQITVDTKTTGVAALFSKEQRVAEASGNVTAAGYTPSRFESRPHNSDKTDLTTMTYDAAGQLTTRIRKPEDDTAWRPPVPTAQASTATDPVTGGLILRRKIHEALAGGSPHISTKTYDGARLADMRVTLAAKPVTLEILDKDIAAIDASIARTPIAGYTPKELKKFKAGDPDIHIFFGADEKALPLRVTIDAVVGHLTATLVELK